MNLWRVITTQLTKARRILLSLPAVIRTRPLSRLKGVRVVRTPAPAGGRFTNPSLAWFEGELLISLRQVSYFIDGRGRYVNESVLPESSTWISAISADTLAVTRPFERLIEEKAHKGLVLEDPRLVVVGDRLMALMASRDYSTPEYRVQMVVARVSGSSLRVESIIESPTGRALEKNWMPYVRDGHLEFVYWLESMQRYRYVDGSARSLGSALKPASHLAGLSGSSQFVRWKGGWLGVAHSHTVIPLPGKWAAWRFYRHQFVYFSENFDAYQTSRSFHFLSRGIEFCSGAAVGDGAIFLGFGTHDAKAYVARVEDALIERLLVTGPVRVDPEDARRITARGAEGP